jgi:SHS2 domain-containing protein
VPPELIEARELVRVQCTAGDLELLLLDWLSAVVYQMAAGRMIFCQFKVRIQGGQLEGQLLGEPLEVSRHQPGVEVKAATATELRVAQMPDGTWLAQCVVDV